MHCPSWLKVPSSCSPLPPARRSYARSPFVLQSFVYGNSLRAQVGGVAGAVGQWAEVRAGPAGDAAPGPLARAPASRPPFPASRPQLMAVVIPDPQCLLLLCPAPSNASRPISSTLPTNAQLVAVVVPDPEYLLPWARERGLPRELADLCAHPQVGCACRGGCQGRLQQGRASRGS